MIYFIAMAACHCKTKPVETPGVSHMIYNDDVKIEKSETYLQVTLVLLEVKCSHTASKMDANGLNELNVWSLGPCEAIKLKFSNK